MKGVSLGRGQAPFWWLLLAAAGLLVAACDSGAIAPLETPTSAPVASATPAADGGSVPAPVTVTPAPSPTGLSESDRIAVYVSVISDMLSKEGKEVGRVYISPYIAQGEYLDNPDEKTPIPPKLLAALESADQSKSRVYSATDFGEAVNVDDGNVKNGGVFITLGPILNEGGKTDAVSVRASVYRKAGSAEGNIYSLNRAGNGLPGWKLLATIPEWSAAQP